LIEQDPHPEYILEARVYMEVRGSTAVSVPAGVNHSHTEVLIPGDTQSKYCAFTAYSSAKCSAGPVQCRLA
jgi:hypothetical protein